MKHLFKKDEMVSVKKHGISLLIPDMTTPEANIVHASVLTAHAQEFLVTRSNFMYTLLSGRVCFFINDKPTIAETGDIVIIPPKSRIWYVGEAEMILMCAPAYTPDQEQHIRDISEEEVAAATELHLPRNM